MDFSFHFENAVQSQKMILNIGLHSTAGYRWDDCTPPPPSAENNNSIKLSIDTT